MLALSRSAPRRLGRYELIAPLATGGMAELYLGRLRGHGRFEKLVAIKRMKPHLSDDPGFVAMFLDEGRIAARLTHPNICQVHELGEDDGQLYMAMEYVPGIPLSTILAALPRTGDGFDLRVSAGILVQVSEGVHFAHEHRADVASTACHHHGSNASHPQLPFALRQLNASVGLRPTSDGARPRLISTDTQCA